MSYGTGAVCMRGAAAYDLELPYPCPRFPRRGRLHCFQACSYSRATRHKAKGGEGSHTHCPDHSGTQLYTLGLSRNDSFEPLCRGEPPPTKALPPQPHPVHRSTCGLHRADRARRLRGAQARCFAYRAYSRLFPAEAKQVRRQIAKMENDLRAPPRLAG